MRFSLLEIQSILDEDDDTDTAVSKEDSWFTNGISDGIAADIKRVVNGEGFRSQDVEVMDENIRKMAERG